jgi:L,D-peptidoglycan transpeptidase YkuD (ErfK/YbiS/YcfS/YnhG family)
MKYIALIIALCSPGVLHAQIKDFGNEFQTKQLIIVTAPSWNSIHGTLSFYERDSQNKWITPLQNISVTLGRAGMAWGKGLQPANLNTGVLKHEGDGKSPAGIFKLTTLFGYGEMESGMDFIQADSTLYCVDDVNSPYYNQLVSTRNVSKDWNSAEDMKRKDVLYKSGVVVAYNTDPVRKGDGSCIFLHIWKSSGDSTSGCTAMTESNLLMLIQALDKKKNPILVQIPVAEYEQLKKLYTLP